MSFYLTLQGQPAGYYDSASGMTGTSLQQVLHDIIDNHTVVTYSDLWTLFQSTDKKPDGTVWDMYSDKPSGTPAYVYSFIINQCGNYDSEGDCYNREHSFPKSWFGGDVTPMYTDLFHLYPTDGYVNGQRGNLPLGTVSDPQWTSTNGSKRGNCSCQGFSGEVFEPIPEYRGDFARTYFYMAVRYYGEDTTWPGSEMTDGSQLKTWALPIMTGWNISDPVSQKERERNEAVYLIQGNRNPFIDNPSYANLIWGSQTGTERVVEKEILKIWPNPADDIITIEVPDRLSENYNIRIINAPGMVIMDKEVSGRPLSVDVSTIAAGYYIVLIMSDSNILSSPLIVEH